MGVVTRGCDDVIERHARGTRGQQVPPLPQAAGGPQPLGVAHVDGGASEPDVHLDQIRQRLGPPETVDRVPGPMGDPLDSAMLRPAGRTGHGLENP